MIKLIKKWYERRRKKRILKIIKAAKQNFLDNKSDYMCLCFYDVCYPKFWDYNRNIQAMIPEFNRLTMGATTPKNTSIWWFADDRESRIKAFDKLIEIYENKIKQI